MFLFLHIVSESPHVDKYICTYSFSLLFNIHCIYFLIEYTKAQFFIMKVFRHKHKSRKDSKHPYALHFDSVIVNILPYLLYLFF